MPAIATVSVTPLKKRFIVWSSREESLRDRVRAGWASYSHDAAESFPEDYAAIAALFRDTIAADRSPLSPRVRGWKSILDKLESTKPRVLLPPLKPPGEPSMVMARMRGTKQRR